MNYETRLAEATAYSEAGKIRAKTTPEPNGQKFPRDSRVRIADNLGPSMSHFKSGCNATVKYTYAHAFGGDDVKSYWLDIDDYGECGWYYEYQLTAISSVKCPKCGYMMDEHKSCPKCGVLILNGETIDPDSADQTLLGVAKRALAQLRFYDGNATILGHDKELIEDLEIAIVGWTENE